MFAADKAIENGMQAGTAAARAAGFDIADSSAPEVAAPAQSASLAAWKVTNAWARAKAESLCRQNDVTAST